MTLNGENTIRGPIAWPMDASRILLSLCKFDPEDYKFIYTEQIKYLKACADAESAMYGNILKKFA
jgi:hypothetical protein